MLDGEKYEEFRTSIGGMISEIPRITPLTRFWLCFFPTIMTETDGFVMHFKHVRGVTYVLRIEKTPDP